MQMSCVRKTYHTQFCDINTVLLECQRHVKGNICLVYENMLFNRPGVAAAVPQSP